VTRAVLVGLGLAALTVSPATALDCQRASSASEKAICADPTALAADADLGKAFAALHASFDPKAKTNLVAAEVDDGGREQPDVAGVLSRLLPGERWENLRGSCAEDAAYRGFWNCEAEASTVWINGLALKDVKARLGGVRSAVDDDASTPPRLRRF